MVLQVLFVQQKTLTLTLTCLLSIQVCMHAFFRAVGRSGACAQDPESRHLFSRRPLSESSRKLTRTIIVQETSHKVN
jgi:hypothetical protein